MKALKVLSFAVVFVLIVSTGFVLMMQELPDKSNTWFSAAGACVLCHSTSEFALRDSRGDDVSPVARWRSTMLANSSKDPFWKAKVKHEGLVNPAHKDALENVCTRCHAPMGMLNALFASSAVYNMDSLARDEIGKDGVSCTLCHQINDFNSPLFSGHFEINDLKEIYGPYKNPMTVQMVMNSGYTPVYSERINDSRLCGSCHTLFTNSVDEQGVPTGETFVEQALYHEWENSVYGEQNISCQSCHMPRIHEPIKISSRPGILTGREPFGIHNFTGGNLFMLNFLKENHDALQLHSGVDLLEQSIIRTQELLTTKTVELAIREIFIANDSVFVEVTLRNLAGHKFPTGFPSRRAFIECLVTQNNDTLFHSGRPGSAALNHTDNEKFEPHYEVINHESQVQIYEFVMGDIHGSVTTVLEKAYMPLKDNRIVPEGFQFSHVNYDTVKVVGKATLDPDYFSGFGIESVIYAFPAAMIGTSAEVAISLHYETVPESWLNEMFAFGEMDADIQLFRNLYYKADRSPVLIASESKEVILTSITDVQHTGLSVYPNPTTGRIRVEGIHTLFSYNVYTLGGVLVKSGSVGAGDQEISLSLLPGNYLFIIQTIEGKYTRHLVITGR